MRLQAIVVAFVVWILAAPDTITSTNPNGGDDITCDYRYVFAGDTMKCKSKRCQ